MVWSWWQQRGVRRHADEGLDVFKHMATVEWDTLLFFGGVLLSVGALQELGWLARVSSALYGEHTPLVANTIVGLLSALIDNVPVMYAVLAMNPAMGRGLAARDADRRGRRLAAVDRLGGRRGPDGLGAWQVHVFRAPALDAGDRARLRRVGRGPASDS
jgi:hypothetical protein